VAAVGPQIELVRHLLPRALLFVGGDGDDGRERDVYVRPRPGHHADRRRRRLAEANIPPLDLDRNRLPRLPWHVLRDRRADVLRIALRRTHFGTIGLLLALGFATGRRERGGDRDDGGKRNSKIGCHEILSVLPSSYAPKAAASSRRATVAGRPKEGPFSHAQA